MWIAVGPHVGWGCTRNDGDAVVVLPFWRQSCCRAKYVVELLEQIGHVMRKRVVLVLARGNFLDEESWSVGGERIKNFFIVTASGPFVWLVCSHLYPFPLVGEAHCHVGEVPGDFTQSAEPRHTEDNVRTRNNEEICSELPSLDAQDGAIVLRFTA